jgi:hypothetical protein
MGVPVDEASCGEGGRPYQDHWGEVDVTHKVTAPITKGVEGDRVCSMAHSPTATGKRNGIHRPLLLDIERAAPMNAGLKHLVLPCGP